MKYDIIGVRYVNYVKKVTGEVISAFEIYVTNTHCEVKGLCCDKLFIKETALPEDLKQGINTCIGGKLDVEYDRKGFPISYVYIPVTSPTVK